MRLEDDSISEDECPFLDERLDAGAERRGSAGIWLRLPPAAVRPLALLCGAALCAGLALSLPALGVGLVALVREKSWALTLSGLACGGALWGLGARAQPERWRGQAIDRVTLRLAPWLGLGACAAAPLAPALLVVAGALLLGGALMLLPWHWRRRAERAWLLHKPGYSSAVLVTLLTLVGLPALAGLGLRWGARQLQARVESASRAWSTPAADCLERVRQAVPGSPWDKLALSAFGAQLGGRPGQDLAQCLAPELEERETLAQRLKFDSGQLCQREASPYNRDRFADWFRRRERLLGARWLVQALDADAQRDYGDALLALATAGAVCDDPFLLPQALLFAAADARGALGGCGAKWATVAQDVWVREALLRWHKVALPQTFTGDQFPLAGRAYFSRGQGWTTGQGYVHTEPVQSVALRPRADGTTFEVGLHLRWLRAAQVGQAMNPWMQKHQRGNEIYVNDCAEKKDAARLLDGLRDQWGFADRRRMGTSACPRGFGQAEHHVLPFTGGQAFVVAQYQILSGTAQVRLAFTGSDPCQE